MDGAMVTVFDYDCFYVNVPVKSTFILQETGSPRCREGGLAEWFV